MNVSSAASPYWLHIEHSTKSTSALKNTFCDVLKNEQAINNASVSDELQSDTAIQEIAAKEDVRETSEPSYTVTEEEAEYFREKYGEKFDDNEPFEFFDELAEKNIISQDDAYDASRKNRICLVEGFPNTDIIDKLLAVNGGHYSFNVKFNFKKSDYTDSGNSTYNEYLRGKNEPVNTWQDYVQDNYDYYKYLMENYTMLRNFAGEPYVTDIDDVFSSRCAGAERVQKVLSQIFV